MWRYALMGLLLWLAGCGANDPITLPTLASLPSETPTQTATVTLPPTWTPTNTPSATATQTATPSSTPSPVITATPTLTVTPSITITDTPTHTPTATATATHTPEPPPPHLGLLQLLQAAAQATLLPTALLPTPAPFVPTAPPLNNGVVQVNCLPPEGAFAVLFLSDPSLPNQLGCPALGAVALAGAMQPFERGMMLWVQGQPGTIYALSNDGRLTRYGDTFVDGVDPVSGGETAPAGLREPIRGFGKVWRTDANARAAFGWAVGEESALTVSLQNFERGAMLGLVGRGQVYILDYVNSTWRILAAVL
jgi:hypothetical protein